MTIPYLAREIAAAARWLADHARARAGTLPVRIPPEDFCALEFELIDWMLSWIPGRHQLGLTNHVIGDDCLEAEGSAVSEDLGRCLDDVAYIALRPGHVATKLKSGGRPIVVMKEGGAADTGTT